jgi:diguanylate cyclase (GGDEF)-like protein
LFLKRSLLSPVRRVVEANRALAEGREEGRAIPEDAIPDNEIGEILRSQNVMLARLARSEEEFRKGLYRLMAVTCSDALRNDTGGAQEALERLLGAVMDVTGADAADISVADGKAGDLALRAVRGHSAERVVTEEVGSLTGCLCRRLASGGQPLVTNNLPGDPRVTGIACRRDGFEAFACVPLRAEGRVLGALSLHNRSRLFSSQDRMVLEAIGHQVGLALENMRLYEQVRSLATTDDLTGFRTRRYFMERLEQEYRRATRYDQPFAVILLDLDHFKAINDRSGHLMGDSLLRQVAQRLAAHARESDLLGRFGGEEFIVLLPETGRVEALQIAERLRQALDGEGFSADDGTPPMRVTASFGVAAYPDDAQSVEELISCADAALYRAKAMGRNVVVPG